MRFVLTIGGGFAVVFMLLVVLLRRPVVLELRPEPVVVRERHSIASPSALPLPNGGKMAFPQDHGHSEPPPRAHDLLLLGQQDWEAMPPPTDMDMWAPPLHTLLSETTDSLRRTTARLVVHRSALYNRSADVAHLCSHRGR